MEFPLGGFTTAACTFYHGSRGQQVAQHGHGEAGDAAEGRSALYSAESLPFEAPATGKIAVKVINHFGDEVLKVYPVA